MKRKRAPKTPEQREKYNKNRREKHALKEKGMTPEQREERNKAKREEWANMPIEKKIAAKIKRNERRAEKRKSQPRQRNDAFIYDENQQVIAKICIECNREKKVEEYKKPGRSKCRECENGMHLKRRYGMTYDDKRQRYSEQNQQCAICTKHIGFKLSFIDHDHETGKVRGLLCPTCNTYLGILGDGKETKNLLALFAYIHKSSSEEKKKEMVDSAISILKELR